MIIQDVRGRSFDTARVPQRIVSLVPSLTESLFAFGAGERVVGITDYCIHPREGVAAKQRIGGTKYPRVSDILTLTPDLVIANVEENRKPDIEALERQGIPVFVEFPRTLRAALDDLRALALLVGATNASEILDPILAELAARKASRTTSRARVFVAIWRAPWMTANGDSCIGNLIEICGGENVFQGRERKFPLAADLGAAAPRTQEGADTRYPRVSLAEVVNLKPDVILLPDEPYAFGAQDVAELRSTQGLEHARIHLVDGTLICWSGIRLGRAMQTVASLIHPAPILVV